MAIDEAALANKLKEMGKDMADDPMDEKTREAFEAAVQAEAEKQKAAFKTSIHQLLIDLEDDKMASHVESFKNAVAGMADFASDPAIQAKGCWVMGYNAVENFTNVLRANGHKAVINALRLHPQQGRLQADGCEALRILAAQSEGARQILAAGGLQQLLISKGVQKEDPTVQQEVCGALRNLAAMDAVKVLNAGGLEAVLEIMDSCDSYSWVQMWGCQALTFFAKENAKRVAAASGFEAVEFAVNKFKKVDAVRDAGLETLRYRPFDDHL